MAFLNPDVLRGCDATVKFDGQVFMFGTELTFDENGNQKAIRGIGKYKPLGSSPMYWEGTLEMTGHVLTAAAQGSKVFYLTDEVIAATAFELTITQKSSQKVVAIATAFFNTRNFNLSIENTSEQRLNFLLVDIVYKEGFR